MKQFLMCTMFLFLVISSFCQQTDHSQSLTQDSYMRKSNNQNAVAGILLGAGLFLVAVYPIFDRSKSGDRHMVPTIIGVASMLGSIPLIIAAHRNKRKTMTVSTYFEIRQYPVPAIAGLGFYVAPTLSLKTNF